jgi:hypothetical protein
MAAGKRLGEKDHIRLDAPMLDCQKASSAAKAGLDLVSNEQGPIFLAELLGSRKIASSGMLTPLP